MCRPGAFEARCAQPLGVRPNSSSRMFMLNLRIESSCGASRFIQKTSRAARPFCPSRPSFAGRLSSPSNSVPGDPRSHQIEPTRGKSNQIKPNQTRMRPRMAQPQPTRARPGARTILSAGTVLPPQPAEIPRPPHPIAATTQPYAHPLRKFLRPRRTGLSTLPSRQESSPTQAIPGYGSADEPR